MTTVGECVAAHARDRPTAAAFVTRDSRCGWDEYDRQADRVAAALAAVGIRPGAKVAVLLPDGPDVHAAFVGGERAGAVVVGIGHRAGRREIEHLVRKTDPRLMITDRPDASAGLPLLPWPPAGPVEAAPRPPADPEALFLINSTSGTTGLPKCVTHTQRRWFYFHSLAVEAGDLTPDDVFLSAVPMPFGFGLWTSHFTPAILGCPVVLSARFDAGATLDLIEREQVSVLACVTTQFMMLLDEQQARPRDVASLRLMYTGGEAVPYRRAEEFEDCTGAKVLQFYGSNETGALSRTTTRDSRRRRLGTAGRVIDDMQVRVFDDAGHEVVGRRRRGIPGCRGPATCSGYYEDEEANRRLMTDDGWMLMADVVEIDAAGYLRVVGRVSDLIIRGGKNISAPAVEAEVATHPGISVAAAVAFPDPVYGERVGVYAEVRPGYEQLTLDELVGHLSRRGVSKEWFPERLVVVEALPRTSGGKVDKGTLQQRARGDGSERA